MLQPDKLKKLNENALKMSEAGRSKEEILAMKDAFIEQFGEKEPVKKKIHQYLLLQRQVRNRYGRMVLWLYKILTQKQVSLE